MSKADRQRHRLKTVAKEWTPFVEVQVTGEMRAASPHLKHLYKRWVNSRFCVDSFQVSTPLGGVVQLAIARHGLLNVADWNECERVRLELFGPEYLAIELYHRGVHPASMVRVLWIMPEGHDLPFGLDKANVWGANG